MAQFLDPLVELSLLQRRFPDVSIKECGQLISDYFCAHQVTCHTYDGRLFLTEKAILFVSTFSDGHDYDICIKLSDVNAVTTFHKSIVPSIQVSLKDREELFTNFYNLVTVVNSLNSLLPGKIVRSKSSGSQRKLNRFMSVPAQPVNRQPSPPPSYETAIKEDTPVIKVEPCQFFARCGFCPREPLCKLYHSTSDHYRLTNRAESHDHTSFLPPNNHGNGHHESSREYFLSPSKRFHLQDNMTDLFGEADQLNDKMHLTLSNKNGAVEYGRSLSSPVKTLDCSPSEGRPHPPERADTDTITHSKVGQTDDLNVNLSGSLTKPMAQTVALSTDGGSTAVQDSAHPRETDHSPNLMVPSSFDFTSDPQDQGSSVCIDDEVKAEVQSSAVNGDSSCSKTVMTDSQNSEVFVFKASSNPPSPEAVQGKRRNAALPFHFPRADGQQSSDADGRGGDEKLAALTQQMELASADNDSLQDDLDLDHQRNLLASFTNSDSHPLYEPLRFSDLRSPSPKSKITLPVSTGKEAKTEPENNSTKGGSHKRRHCVYFLAGHCGNGTACPEFHGVVPETYEDLEALMEEADIPMVEIPKKISVFSASSLGRSDMNSGDKVILSSQILMACEQQELSYPVAFKLEHPASRTVVHAGVLEFTSPLYDHGYLPQWMMDHLGARDGDEVDFKCVELPKGTFVRLQPVSSAWLGIPYDKRMAMMEFQLRNFQTLTEGTKVTLTYELNRYTLKVLECKPAKGISIVDADLTTDIVEPADFNRYHSIEEGQAVNIGLDEPTTCSVDENTYRHFVLLFLPGQPLPSRLRVHVQPVKGDADLFLSQSCTAPSQVRYTWCNQNVGDSEFCLSEESGHYDVQKPLYAGVVSLCGEAEFTITFHREDTMAATKDRQKSPSGLVSGRSLQDTLTKEETDSNAEPLAKTPPSPLPPGQERCAYCGSVMQSLRLLMHERHCAQSTFKCPTCKVCLPKAAEKKHHFIAHEVLKCDCDVETTQLALHSHQLRDCPKRLVKCSFKWCNLSFPMDQLQNHENLCGRKKVPCPLCNEDVSQLELEIHLEVYHFVDPSTLDWTQSIANQVVKFKPTEPKFKCACGVGFEFEDDYQVHQVVKFKPTEPKFKCVCGVGFEFEDDYQVHQLTECPQANPPGDSVGTTPNDSVENNDNITG